MSNFNFIKDRNKLKIYLGKKWFCFLLLLICSFILFKYVFSVNQAPAHLKLTVKPNNTKPIQQEYNPLINLQYVGYIGNKQQILALIRLANQQLITVKVGDILIQKNYIITQINPSNIIILTTDYLQNTKKWHKLLLIQGGTF
jgi:Tfp pilus assembly protein PilP